MKTNIPWIESPFFDELLASKKLGEDDHALAKAYNEKGYMILKNHIDPSIIDKLLGELAPHFPDHIDGEPRRRQDFWHEANHVKDLALDEEVFRILRMLYDREPVPFQTLNFKYGTEQSTHSDTIHFNCRPSGYMVGVWVALEDINSENGGLFYYPGSHKLPEYDYQQLGIPIEPGEYEVYDQYEEKIDALTKSLNLDRTIVDLKKGDVFIWASNLLHGGLAVNKRDRTRWSQVTHYYFEDCIYFTPMKSDMRLGELFLREIPNIKTGIPEKSSYDGRPISKFLTDEGRYMISNPTPYGMLQNTRFVDVAKILWTRIFK